MTPVASSGYTGRVDFLRSRAPRWIAAGLVALVAAFAAPAGPASAETSLDVADQAVVIIQVAGKGNELTVRTWDRSTVQIESSDMTPAVERRAVVFGTDKIPLAAPIPPMQYPIRENGQVTGTGIMPPEDFPYASFRPGPHDWVRVTAEEGSHITVTVPATTGILQTRVGQGQTEIDGYRGANLFLVQGAGRVHLSGLATTAFVQMNYGAVYASDDTFDRVRLRSNAAHIVFEHCRSKQIEVTTITGSVIYDGGSFDPGLARFESQSGSIGLGVTSAAQLAARSQDGHVFTQFDRRTPVEQNPDGSATANVGGNGGPLVNAISTHGNVFLYDGTLATRRIPATADWRPIHQILNARRRGPAAAPRPPAPHASEPHPAAAAIRARAGIFAGRQRRV